MNIFKNKSLFALALLLAVVLPVALACSAKTTSTTRATTTTASQANYPNAALLVAASWLKDHVDDANLVIIDARSSSAYGAGHIKNAINLAPALFDGVDAKGATTTELLSVSGLSNLLGQNGVSGKAKIVVYSSSIDANAGRIFWLLEYLGQTDAHIRDGGYDKWTKDSYPTATDKTVKPATTFTASVDASRLATKAQVLANYNNSSFAIVDSRNAADYAPKHIPNAINILVGDYLNADGTMESFSDLTSFLASKGISPSKTVITHCYVGYRSAQAYFAFRMLGYKVSNYDGSWTEWSADPSLPTAL